MEARGKIPINFNGSGIRPQLYFVINIFLLQALGSGMYVYSELFLHCHSLGTLFSIILKHLIIITTVASFEALRNTFSKDKVSVTPNTCSRLPVPHEQALLHVTNNCLLAQLKAVEKESLAPSFVCEKKTLINVYGNNKPMASSPAVGRETVNL